MKTTQNWRHVYLQAADQAQTDPAPTTLINYYAVVRPNLLSSSNMRRLATAILESRQAEAAVTCAVFLRFRFVYPSPPYLPFSLPPVFPPLSSSFPLLLSLLFRLYTSSLSPFLPLPIAGVEERCKLFPCSGSRLNYLSLVTWTLICRQVFHYQLGLYDNTPGCFQSI